MVGPGAVEELPGRLGVAEPAAAATEAVAAGAAAAQAMAGAAAVVPEAGTVPAEGVAVEAATTEAAPEVTEPPSPREAVAPAVQQIRQRAVRASGHTPAGTIQANAQAAAVRHPTEQQRGAAVATVQNLDAAGAETETFQRESFRATLAKAIEDATPKPTNEDQANEVISTGARTASATVQGQLGAQRDAAAGPLAQPASAEVKPADVDTPEPEVGLQLEQVGPPPAPVAAAPVVPAPLPPERLDYSEDRQATDSVMAESGVTQGQLEKGNEPEFGETLTARTEAEEHEAQVAATYRAGEAEVRGSAEQRAQGTLAGGLAGMQEARAGAVGTVAGRQTGTMTKDEAERRRVTVTIEGIKTRTRTDVETILREMETEAARIFGEGLTAAEKAYRNTFEEAKGGVGTWLTTWGDDWEELIEDSLATARTEYLRHVNLAIDRVADCVDAKLAAAKRRVAEGLAEAQVFVAGLDLSLQAFGAETLASVSTDFDAMTQSIDARKDALVESLTNQYKASYERMSAMEEELRAANKSLWQRVYDATVGLVKKILAFKDMLLSILAKAADVVSDIISDPIGFLGNLVAGVALGLENFIANIGAHLKKGLMDWLFGALGGAGITMPDSFDLKGIVSIVLQVLGLTYANFRARAVKIVGEPVVSALEQAAEVFKVIATEGIPGLWRFIQEKVADLKAMVLDAIWEFIQEKVIVAGITWIVGLLNPASAFFKACKAIYDIVMFFINRGSQIIDLVNAVIDSIGAIAKGSISVAATFVENALAKAIPVAIGFLASLLGLGDISTTIRNTIDKARAPVNDAIDWLIGKAVALVQAAGNLVAGAFGGKKKKEEPVDEEPEDPVRAAQVTAGLAAIDAEERPYLDEGRLTREAAETVAAKVKSDHPVFSSITVVEGEERWNYAYAASPTKTKEGELKAPGEEIVEVAVINSKEPIPSDVGSVSAPFTAEERAALSGTRVGPTIFEQRIGGRLEEELGVTAQTTQVEALRDQASVAPLPTEGQVLLEQQVVTAPGPQERRRGKKPPLGSAVPDFLVISPTKVEVFEVTLDASFSIKPQEKGLRVKGERQGDPHKIIQLAKVRYLAERFPGVPIVYNIQTSGQPMPEHVRSLLETQLKELSREMAVRGLTNPVQVIWRT
ncbi:phage tail protein [Georgenia muralis]